MCKKDFYFKYSRSRLMISVKRSALHSTNLAERFQLKVEKVYNNTAYIHYTILLFKTHQLILQKTFSTSVKHVKSIEFVLKSLANTK